MNDIEEHAAHMKKMGHIIRPIELETLQNDMESTPKEAENVEEKFKREFKELLTKHGITLEDNDEYDGGDNYVGTNYYFSGNGILIEMGELLR